MPLNLLLQTLFGRFLVRRPWRFLITVLGVAVGIASLSATLLANRAALESMRSGVIEISGEARLAVTAPGGVDETLLADLRAIAGAARIVPVMEEIVLLPELGDSVRLMGIEPLADRDIRNLNLDVSREGGEDLFEQFMRGEGVVLPEELLTQLDAEVGQKVTLLIQSRTVETTLLGSFTPRRFAPVWNRVILMDVARAQELTGRLGTVDRIELAPRPGYSLEELEAKAGPLIPNDYSLVSPQARASQTDRMVRALEFNLTALSGISILVGAVIVATTLSTAVVQRRYVLALARSLGGSSKQIAGSIAVEALLIGLCGGVLGVALGYFGAQLALPQVRATVASVMTGVPAAQIEWYTPYAIAGVLLGMLVSLAAAWLPIWEARQTPPVQELRNENPQSAPWSIQRNWLLGIGLCLLLSVVFLNLPPLGGLPIAALLSALFLLVAMLIICHPLLEWGARYGGRVFGRLPALRVAMSALASSRRRAAWGAGSIGVAVALAIGVATMVDSFRVTVQQWADQGIRADLWVRPLRAETGVPVGHLHPQIVQIAQEVFGMEAVDPVHREPLTYRDRPLLVGGAEFNVVQHHGGVPFMDGRAPHEVFSQVVEQGGVVVNEPFLNRFGLGKGDLVQLQTPEGMIEKTIRGVFYDYSSNQGLVMMDLQAFQQYFPQSVPTGMAVFLPPDTDLAQARQAFMQALDGRWQVEVLLNAELRQEVLRVFDRTFAITTALQRVATLVAVIAILVVLFALVGERKHDLALLRVVGASPLQIGGVVISQAGILAALGAVGGVVVGLMKGWILVTVVNKQSFGWTLQFLPAWELVAMTLLSTLPICLLVALLPAWNAVRSTAREVLRDDA